MHPNFNIVLIAAMSLLGSSNAQALSTENVPSVQEVTRKVL